MSQSNKPSFNQTTARSTPGTYADTWKPIFAWHLGDVLEHARLDLDLDADLVSAYLYQMNEQDKLELDTIIEQFADNHNENMAPMFCNFSKDVFDELQKHAIKWRQENT